MPLNPDVKTLTAAVGICVDTTANWTLKDPVLPKGLLALDETTGTIKVGDGISKYSKLAVKIDATLTQAQRTMLDNYNAANGVAVLDANGKLSMSMMPDAVASGSVKFVADIAARDALTGTGRDGLIYVLNATADNTVTLGSAFYVWHEDTTSWEKIGEKESLDIDLTPYFDHTTETLDIIADGTSYVKFTPAERTELATLSTDAVRYTDTIFISGMNATQLADIQAE